MEFFNRILADCIFTAQKAAEDAAVEYAKLRTAEEYTDVYKVQKRGEISEAAAKISEEMKAQGFAAIDRAIEQQKAADLDGAKARAFESDYTRRLNDKIDLVKRLASKAAFTDKEIEVVRIALAEYENDTLAITALKSAAEGAPGAALLVRAIPEDHTGEYQKDMEFLKTMFSAAIDETQTGSVETFSGYKKQSVEAFYYYCTYQGPTLKSDPGETWNRVCTDHPELYTAAGMWAMRFGVADQITK